MEFQLSDAIWLQGHPKHAKALDFILNPGSHAQLATKVVQEIASQPVDVVGSSQAAPWIVQPAASIIFQSQCLGFRAIFEEVYGNYMELYGNYMGITWECQMINESSKLLETS